MSSFLDTNILLYADDSDAGEKLTAARALVRRAVLDLSGVISTQVLQEYYVNARKKLGMDGASARGRIEIYRSLPTVIVDVDLILAATDLSRLDEISFWDALIVRSAERARCEILYSEDLQHGRRYGGVRVVNPFL